MTSEEPSGAAKGAVEDLTRQLGRAPHPSELASYTRSRLDEVIEAEPERTQPRGHLDSADEQSQQPDVVDESMFRNRVARALGSEIATHRKAIEVHEAAVTQLSDSGNFDGAAAARVRLAYARKRLNEAVEQQRLLLRLGRGAMAAGPDEVAHAVAADRPVSMCGLELAHMVSVTEDFNSLPSARRCPDCVQAMEPEL